MFDYSQSDEANLRLALIQANYEFDKASAERDVLRAENELLRTALAAFVSKSCKCPNCTQARAALKGGGGMTYCEAFDAAVTLCKESQERVCILWQPTGYSGPSANAYDACIESQRFRFPVATLLLATIIPLPAKAVEIQPARVLPRA